MLRPVRSGPATPTETGPENVRREDPCDPQPLDHVYGEPNSEKCYIAVRSGIGYPKDATRAHLEDLTVDGKLTKDPDLQRYDGERCVVYLPWCVLNATRTVQHTQTSQTEKLWDAVRPFDREDTGQGGPKSRRRASEASSEDAGRSGTGSPVGEMSPGDRKGRR